MEFRLRDYQDRDFEVLWAIDQQCFAPGIAYSRRELSIYIRRRGAFTIIAESEAADGVKGSGVAGFIVAEANRRGVGHIISIDVLPTNRRFGLGSTLLASAEARLKTANCHTVVLETAVDNTGALSFYKRRGYDILKTSPRYYSNGIDAFVLGKRLASLQHSAD